MKKKLYDKEEMSLEDFKEYIEKTYRGKYSGKYTLDESTWIDKDTPMMIHCREHGWFERIPMEFAQGFVCPFESNAMRTHPEWQAKAFVEKGKIKFGDKFEYHIDEYIDAKTPTRITCKEHGDFITTPDNHLNATLDGGCLGCYAERMHNHFVKTTEDYIKEAKEVWGDKIWDCGLFKYVWRN